MPKRNTGPKIQWRADRQYYEIIWYNRGLRTRKRAGDTLDEANRVLALAIQESQQPKRNHTPENITISEVLEEYYQDRIDRPSAETIFYAIKSILANADDIKVLDIDESFCRKYATQSAVKPATVARNLSVLASAINLAYKRGKLSRPIHIWKPTGLVSKDRWLSRSEVAKLLISARNKASGDRILSAEGSRHLSLFILIGLYTGARRGAILDLTWDRVDFERNEIDFNPKDRLKTNKIRARVPIARPLLTILKHWRGKAKGRHVIEYYGIPVDSISKSFRRAAARVNLDGVTPHVLRHTCATWLTAAGVPFPQIARYIGHNNSATTERIYAHHAPNYLDGARSALEKKR